MPGLRLRFPGGRYHATLWGHHVNEGQVEWPPSPWRILRALIARGFTTQQWTKIPECAWRLVEKLAGAHPSYRLPAASVAHSRHYMPVGSLDKGREKTTLVFDTWLDVGDEELLVWWDCALTSEESRLLRTLAEGLNYLGRSESWVEGTFLDVGPVPEGMWNARPHQEGSYLEPGWEHVALMAPIRPAEYAKWREATTARLLAVLPLPDGKKKPSPKLLKDRANAVAPYPETLLECLLKDTAWWKQHRWSQPPGSQKILYWRPEGAIQVSSPTRPKASRPKPVTTMLLAITTASGNRSSLPGCERTLPQAELLHKALVGVLGQGMTVDCPEITGRGADGRPLQESHRHAHILPVDLDGDDRLDHIFIHAPMGLGGEAQRAIRNVRRTWTKGGSGDLQLALAGSGGMDAFRRLPPPLGGRVERLLGPSGGARVWVSATPFIPPRFLKKRGANTLEGQIQAELASRGLPAAVEVCDLRGSDAAFAMRHYVRRRQRGGGAPPTDTGYALRLRFEEPVSGPLTLGYAAHYGLGLFVAEGV